MATQATTTSPIPLNLRRLRQEAGLTQSQVAEAAEVADATISRIERGRFLPTQDLLERLASAVEASAAELLARQPKPRKSSLRPCEARLLATVRGLDDGQVDDVTRGIKLLLAVGRRTGPR
jgi:transcriptional regulator with XRE-family HTH domain